MPINESISIELKNLLAVTERGHKQFVPDGVSTDIAIARLLGYERPDVTRGYLASLPKGEYQPYSGHKNK